MVAVSLAFGDAPNHASIAALPHNSSFGYTTHDKMAALPNSLLAMTLTSNFGTLVHALSRFPRIVAYTGRQDFNILKHWRFPASVSLANLVCTAFYVAGPIL